MDYVFGPVPSRRLGRSLGVDIVPFKTCSYDCVYCQIGRTTNKTIERKSWVPIAPVLEEVRAKLDTAPDYITVSGSGEPTLSSDIGALIRDIKAMTAIPVAVLTNGSLLWREDVRHDLLQADLVAPSLDAGSAGAFQFANRPHTGVFFDRMLDGIIEFRKEFEGQIWLEVFLLGGFTDSDSEVRKLAECAARIKPDKIQLNTVTRPPAEASARAVPLERLEEFAPLFTPNAEVIAEFRELHQREEARADDKQILDMLRRRPCSLEDIANGLCLHRHQAAKSIEFLLAQGSIEGSQVGETTFFQPVE